MSGNLYLLDAEKVRTDNILVISAYDIVTMIDGAERVIDHANSMREAEAKKAKWEQNNPNHNNAFRIV